MDLERTYIHKHEIMAATYYQTTIDDDYNLPDYRPDIMKMIKCRGRVLLDETKVGSQCVFLQGRMTFEVLYISENMNGRISSLSGEIPFREKINMDGVEEYDPVQVQATVGDMNISVINSRKINVRGILDFMLQVRKMTDVELPTSMGDENGFEVKKGTREVLQLVENKKDMVRIRQEVPLPKEKPNANRLIWNTVLVEGLNTRLQGDGIEVSGTAQVSVLYDGVEETPLEWYETTFSIDGIIQCQMGRECDHFETRVLSLMPVVEIKEDPDREMRNLSLDLNIEFEISLWKEEEVEVLEDVYCLSKDVHLKEQEIQLDRLRLKNYGKVRVAGDIPLDEMEEAMYLCASEAKVVVEETQILENAFRVVGKLLVEVLYLTTDDVIPVASARNSFPFDIELEVNGITDRCKTHLEADIERMNVSLGDRHRAELKAEVQLNLMVFDVEEMKAIMSIEVEPMDMMRLQNTPGMIGYIVQSGDSLWNIARENHTTVEDLKQTNQLGEDDIICGQKLLIVKRVVSENIS